MIRPARAFPGVGRGRATRGGKRREQPEKECVVPQPAKQATLAPGVVLSKRFRIEQLIGSGGYANVYRATDLTFGYDRAIKEVTDP